jgi:hypothetical protein
VLALEARPLQLGAVGPHRDVACVAAPTAGRLDAIVPARLRLDILAQQLVAEVAAKPWRTHDLHQLVRRGAPFAQLRRARFDEVLDLVSRGIQTGRGVAAGRTSATTRSTASCDHAKEPAWPRRPRAARSRSGRGGPVAGHDLIGRAPEQQHPDRIQLLNGEGSSRAPVHDASGNRSASARARAMLSAWTPS